MAKKDRIEKAIEQEYESTFDPATGEVPSHKLYDIFVDLQRQASVSRSVESINWVERGPDNVGGRTRAIVIDQSDATGNTLFIGSVSGGIWKSVNAKSPAPSWSNVSGTMDNLAISTLVQDPGDHNILYAGTGEGFFNVDAVKGNGIWKSINGGNTWTRLSSTANENFYYTQKIGINNDGHLFACTRNNGVMKSVNGGQSWSKVLGQNAGALTNRASDIHIMSDGTIFVSMGVFDTDGIYRSVNNGSSWTKLSGGLPSSQYERIEIGGNATDNNTLYALYQDEQTSECSAIYRTSNKGNSWTQVNLPNAYGMNGFARNQAWYNLSIAVDPSNINRVIVGGIDLHLSENGGQSWTQISQWAGLANIPYVHADQHAIVFDNNNNESVFFGNDGGIARCLDIGSINPDMETINSGYNVTQFYAAAIHPDNASPVIIAGAQDNGTQLFEFDGVNSTTEIAGGDGSFCHIDQNQPNVMISTYVFNNYFVSIDGGSNFSLKSFNNSGRFANPSVYDDNSQKLYASNWAGTYFRWENPAQSGSTTSNIQVSAFGSATVTAVSLSPNVSNRAYFGLNNGDVVRVDNIHSGTSKTGTKILDENAGTISSIAIEKGNENHILVSYSNYGVESIKETVNGGNSWSDVEGDLPDFPVRWIVFDPTDSDKALAATELGVWRTTNLNGSQTDWFSDSGPLSNVRVDMLAFRENDNYLVAATHGRGVFSSTDYVNPKVQFDEISFSVAEQANSGDYGNCNLDYQLLNIPVSISSLPSQTISLNIDVDNQSTAEQLKDFVLLSNTVVFTPTGPTQKDIQLRILDEAVFEQTESVVLELSGSPEYLGEELIASIQIMDDDIDPGQQGTSTVIVGEGTGSSYIYPFGGYYEDEKTQVLYKKEELVSAGLHEGNIEKIGMFITDKNSSSPFNNFNIKMKQVNMEGLGPSGSSFVQGAQSVFSGSLNTVAGWNDFVLSNAFYWDGVSDILVELCFNNSSWSDDDYVRSSSTSFTSVQYRHADANAGCNFTTSSAVSSLRPDLRFEGTNSLVLASELCQKNSTLIQGEKAHFYSSGQLIASVENLAGSNISCLEVTIDRVGLGIETPMWMEGAGVTQKTFYIDAATEAPYEISMYFSEEELSEWDDPTGLSIIKTQSSIGESNGTDYVVLDNNELEVEELGNGIIVYRAVFESFSGFALTNLVPSTLPITIKSFEAEKRVGENLLSWELSDNLIDSRILLQKAIGNELEFESIAEFETGDNLRFAYADQKIREGYSYYKLIIYDYEGRKIDSELKSIFREEGKMDDGTIYPNPVMDKLDISFESAEDEIISVDILSSSNNPYKVPTEKKLKNHWQLQLAELPTGLYIVRITLANGRIQTDKMIKL